MFEVMKVFSILIMVVVCGYMSTLVKCHQNVGVKWLRFTVCKLYLNFLNVENSLSERKR